MVFPAGSAGMNREQPRISGTRTEILNSAKFGNKQLVISQHPIIDAAKRCSSEQAVGGNQAIEWIAGPR